MKKFKDFSFYKREDFWIRLSLSILLLALFVVLFIYCGGSYYFYNIKTVNAFTGIDFQLHVIDVGQADCMLLIFPDDTTMMIDCGGENEGNLVARYVKRILKQEDLSQIDYLLLTHSDEDHIGGAIELLNSFEIKYIMRPKLYCLDEVENGLNLADYNSTSSGIYNRVIMTARAQNCEFIFNAKGLNFDFGGCKLEFLSPSEDSYSKSNNYSAVVMLEYQNKKMLFMGDSEFEVENELLLTYDNLQADILKVAHHGSASSSSIEFLNAVKPNYAIICARENASLPTSTVLNNLNSIGSTILSTALNGSFAFTIQNGEIEVAYEEGVGFDIALLISIITMLIILTWGIKINKKKKQPEKIELVEKD